MFVLVLYSGKRRNFERTKIFKMKLFGKAVRGSA